MHVQGEGDLWGISVPPSKFHSESIIALKNEVFQKKEKSTDVVKPRVGVEGRKGAMRNEDASSC